MNNKVSTLERCKVSKRKAAGRKILFAACGFFFLTLLCGMGKAPTKRVYIRTLKNNNYQLMVDGKPFVVKGVCYNPIPVGAGYDYDWYGDPAKPWIVDGKLMKEMGINTIRLYQPYERAEELRRVIRDLYNLYGIRTIIGHWLGFWEYPCPFYADKAFQERIKKEVLAMVKNYKDEPGVLMWILGNENNYSCLGRVNPWSTDEIDKEPDPQKRNSMRGKIYYSYINDIARSIHEIDPEHPVGLGNGELVGLQWAKASAPDVDLVACIIYRGKSFGNLFISLRATFDKPILLSEFGADAFDAYKKQEDQNMQAFFLEAQWRQIYDNLANSPQGAGNCIGGTMFEWTDEWWKHSQEDPESWKAHDMEGGWSNPSYYFDNKVENSKNMNEEWFGIVALSKDLENGLNKRIPRKAYYVIREFWKNPDLNSKRDKK